MNICEKCGNLIIDFNSLRFCSDHCRHSYIAIISNKKNIVCEICNKIISKSNIKKHLIFHKKQQDKQNKVYKCENCGKEKIGIYGSGRFCSLTCSHRIKWKSINNENGKKYISEEIQKFLEYYNLLNNMLGSSS